MKIKKFGIAAVACALMAAVALPGCSSQPAASSSSSAAEESTEVVLVNDGQLTIAASLDFPPFENLPEGNTTDPEGFAVDLMQAIGEELGLEIVFENQAFDTIIPTIQSGTTADIGVSSFTVTEERQNEIDFTDTYMVSNQGIAVMKDSGITSENYTEELVGKTIMCQSGTTGYDYAVETFTDSEVTALQDMTAVFAALQSGQAAAVVADLPVVQYYVSNAYTDAEVIAEIPTGETYAIVVSKDNPALTEKLNEALATLRENGTYDEIYLKWFGTTPSDSATA